MIESLETNKLNVVLGTPGCAKTSKAVDHINETKEKTALIYQSHFLIDEIEPGIVKEVNHWKGFARVCPEYQKNTTIQELYDALGIRPKLLCIICQNPEKKSCIYKTMFKAKCDAITSPFDFVKTDKFIKVGVKVMFFDEFNPNYDIFFKPDTRTFKRLIQKLNLYLDRKLTYWKLINRANVDKIKDQIEYKITDLLEDSFNNGGEIPQAVYDLTSFNIYDIVNWIKQFRYHRKRIDYGIHYLHYCLDHIANGIKVILLDAYPPVELIDFIVNRYNNENKTEIKTKYVLLEKKINPNSKVIRIAAPFDNDAWYAASSHVNEAIRTRLTERIKYLIKRHSGQRIGFIVYKEHAETYTKINGIQYPYLTFGNLRSSRSLDNVDVLIVVGTYTQNLPELERMADLIFVDRIDRTAEPTPEGHWKYKNKRLEALRFANNDLEQYHAIHRGRSAYRDIIVYVFGIVPDRIKEEVLYHHIQGIEVLKVQDWLEKLMKAYLKTPDKYEGFEIGNKLPYAHVIAKLQKDFKIGRNKSLGLIKGAIELSDRLKFISIKEGGWRPKKYITVV